MTIETNDLQTRLQDPDFRERVRALLTLRDATPEEVAPLAALTIQDSHPQMRSYTCMLLGKKPSEAAYQLLLQTLQADADQGVRADAAGGLGALEDRRAYEVLNRAFYEDTDWIVQYSALVALGNLRDPRAYELFLDALKSKQDLMLQAAVGALGELGEARAVPHLLPLVQNRDWMMRMKVAIALGQIHDPKSLEVLRYLTKDANPQVVAAAEAGLG